MPYLLWPPTRQCNYAGVQVAIDASLLGLGAGVLLVGGGRLIRRVIR